MSKMLRHDETKHLESMGQRTTDAMDALGLSEEELLLAIAHEDYRVIAGEAFSKGISWAEAHYWLMGKGVLSCDKAEVEGKINLENFPERDYGGFARDHRLRDQARDH